MYNSQYPFMQFQMDLYPDFFRNNNYYYSCKKYQTKNKNKFSWAALILKINSAAFAFGVYNLY